MDNSHVALVSLQLNAAAFQPYRCDRNMSLGMSLTSLTKIVKCAQSDDVVTLRADESHDVLGLLFESSSKPEPLEPAIDSLPIDSSALRLIRTEGKDRVGEYEMKLMDIDTEHLGIPDTVYDAEITIPSQEFRRIIGDLKELGESVKIEVSKDGVRFSADGDIGSAAVTLKQTAGADDMDEDSDDDEEEDEEEEEEEAKEEDDEEDDEDKKPEVDSDGEEQVKAPKSKKKAAAAKDKKRKAAASKTKAKDSKKAKKDERAERITISLQQSVALTFSIKYLSNFAKSTPLSDYVHVSPSVIQFRRCSLGRAQANPPPDPLLAPYEPRGTASGRVPVRAGPHPLLPRAQDLGRVKGPSQGLVRLAGLRAERGFVWAACVGFGWVGFILLGFFVHRSATCAVLCFALLSVEG